MVSDPPHPGEWREEERHLAEMLRRDVNRREFSFIEGSTLCSKHRKDQGESALAPEMRR